ncbi:MAG TPA: FAD binding domain-containing protein [Vicinamibacterales bacterium]|nr:FAD binding domain-containing protein [Vicinamibacterales bacterium]
MRSRLRDFELRAPRTLDEALALLSAEPGQWRPFAGGTDLMVLIDAARLPPARYLSLWHLRELHGITLHDDEIVLGALTTYTDVLRSRALQVECPLLCRAAAETGSVATQNRGTIGGNIANASPAADTPPALLVYDAGLDLLSARGIRRVPYDRFHLGYKHMDLAPDELIAAVRVARGRGGWTHGWRKVGTRRAQAISKVGFAAALDLSQHVVRDVRLAFASVAPTVVRAAHAEAAIRGRTLNGDTIRACCDALARDISPIDDIRSTAGYRARVSRNLLEEFLAAALKREA